MESVQLTYDDVMLEFGRRRVVEPITTRVEWCACDELRAKLDRAGIDSLHPE